MRTVFLTAVLIFSVVCDAQDDRYILSAGMAPGAPGIEVSIPIEIDLVEGTLGYPTDIQGWAYGLCHDAGELALQRVADGETTLTVNSGAPPDFNAINDNPVPGTGFTVGVVINFFGLTIFPPGIDYELNVATYSILASSGLLELNFCDTLAIPPVETLVVEDGGASVIPVQEAGLITIGPGVGYELAANGEYDAVTGAGNLEVDVGLRSYVGASFEVAGFSFGLRHDPALLTTSGFTALPALTSLNAGSGPDWLQVDLVPPGGAGITTRAVFDFYQQLTTFPATNTPVLSLSYNTVPSAFEGDIDGLSTTLEWDEGLGGAMPVVNAVILDTWVNEAITFDTEATFPVPVTPFRRADCNSDGSFNVADPIRVLGFLFSNHPPPVCPDACDGNDDGNLDLADSLFLLLEVFGLVQDFPEPYPQCGSDTTLDALGCPIFTGCP